jgi:hypothetical protein
MLPFGVTIPASVAQRSEIPEGLMNYPVHNLHKILEKDGTCNIELLFVAPLHLSPKLNTKV